MLLKKEHLPVSLVSESTNTIMSPSVNYPNVNEPLAFFGQVSLERKRKGGNNVSGLALLKGDNPIAINWNHRTRKLRKFEFQRQYRLSSDIFNLLNLTTIWQIST